MEDKKIQVKPRYPSQPKRNFAQEIDDLKKMVKNVKQQIRQLGKNEKLVDNMIDKDISNELINGTERKGILKNYAKFTMDIQEDDIVKTYMKHAILGYRFD